STGGPPVPMLNASAPVPQTTRSSVSRSLETIELAESTFKCPNCFKSDKIVPVTVRFMMCKYRFFGIKANGEQYTSDW
ncbi:hypothetical protein BGX29_000542, partial [Mortierella sp. GBA35]